LRVEDQLQATDVAPVNNPGARFRFDVTVDDVSVAGGTVPRHVALAFPVMKASIADMCCQQWALTKDSAGYRNLDADRAISSPP
jgi:hypothetical protein